MTGRSGPAPRPTRSGSRRPCRSASACRCCGDRAPACGTCRGCGRARSGMLGVDQRQRHERAAVLGPARDDRQLVEADVVGHDLDDRPAAAARQPDARQIAEEAARAPQLRRRRRQDRLGGVHEPLDERVRARPERQAGAARRAEQVGDSGKRAPLTFVNSSAGPPAAITRRWISAASWLASTGAVISTRSRSRRRWSRKDRRSAKPAVIVSGAHHGSGIPPGPTPGMRSSRRGSRRVCGHGAHAAPAGRGATPTA